MFRYILALLLLSTSYQSLGIPLKPTTSISFKNHFNALANRCENSFLSNQIKSNIDYCADLPDHHKEKQLQCIIFYDINSQLCTAVGDAKLAITEDYTDKIKEEQDVNALCVEAKDWLFTNLTDFEGYKESIDKICRHPVTCGKLCGTEDLMSDDANFYCKYYKWGSDMLKKQVSIISTQEAQVPINSLPLESGNTAENVAVPSVNSELLDVQVKNITKPAETKIDNVNITPAKILEPTNQSIKTETSSQLTQSIQQAPSVLNPEKTDNKVSSAEKVEDAMVEPEPAAVDGPVEKSPVESAIPKTDTNTQNKPEVLEDTQNKQAEDPLKTDVDKQIQMLNNELEHKEAAQESPKNKLPNDIDEYQDSDDGKEGLGDMQGGDDGDDPMLDDVNNKPPLEPKNSVKRIETVVSTFTGEREYYPNSIQDEFADDDDHFFPFFLTAVILVILLYVLYHNKSKVSKVFFGLILEGRSARRRGSRGHAYRRLDTLEQAMSAAAAAPPSKIIY